MWVIGPIVISERQLLGSHPQPDKGATEPSSGGGQRLIASRRNHGGCGSTDQVGPHDDGIVNERRFPCSAIRGSAIQHPMCRSWRELEIFSPSALSSCSAVNSFHNCIWASGEICCEGIQFSEICCSDLWPTSLSCPGILPLKVPYESAKARWHEFWPSASTLNKLWNLRTILSSAPSTREKSEQDSSRNSPS